MAFRTAVQVLFILSHFIGPGRSIFHVLVSDSTPGGTIVASSQLEQLPGSDTLQWEYMWDLRSRFVSKDNPHLNDVERWFHVSRQNGSLMLKHSFILRCTKPHRLFRSHVLAVASKGDFTGTRMRVWIPWTIVLANDRCGPRRADPWESLLETTRIPPLRILVTVPFEEVTDTLIYNEFCYQASEQVLHLDSYVPHWIVQRCGPDVRWSWHLLTLASNLRIEPQGQDLISPIAQCFPGTRWSVALALQVKCPRGSLLPSQEPSLRSKKHGEEVPAVETKEFQLPVSVTIRRPEAFGEDASEDNGLMSLEWETQNGVQEGEEEGVTKEAGANRRRRAATSKPSLYFDQPLYVATVPEEREKGLAVATINVHEPDPASGPVTYSMTAVLDARSQKLFNLDEKTGQVTTASRLDREAVDVHYFRITAMDSGFPPKSATTTLQINVEDANDHPPVFEKDVYETTIKESLSIGSTVFTVRATDSDAGVNAEIHYSILNPFGANEAFRIDPRTGIITSRLALDRETTDTYNLTIQAADQGLVTERQTATTQLLLHIGDENDNYPQFSERTYSVEVPENVNWAANPVIAKIRATDADAGANAALRYSLIGGNTQGHFVIDSLSGDVSVVQPLDYEAIRSYRLVVRAQDGGNPSRSNTTQLLVNVKDINDNAPRFYTTLFQESVVENVPVGHSIVRVQAYDADDGPNAALTYRIQKSASENLPFSVDADTGWVVTVRDLDREENHHYEFEVLAVDHGESPKTASATVILHIQDLNDNDPVFEPKIYEAVIGEDATPGTPVLTVTATDKDENPRLQYTLTGGNTRGRFSLTSQNGQGLLSVAQPLDYKQEKRFVLTVTATDSGGRSDTATVYVNISDANTFSPSFENAPYSASVFEDAPVGTTVLIVSASDGDVGDNARIIYSLSGDVVPEFTINPQTGAITTLKPLDREKVSGYLLTITAQDNGHPPLSDTTDVEITVADINDNAPVFQQSHGYQGSVIEDAPLGTSVVQIHATDADQGLNSRIRYVLDSPDQSFNVDATSGIVRTNKLLDRESVAKYELTAWAVDKGSPELSTSVPVTILIEDINDSPPSFDTDKIKLFIQENSPIGSHVGDIVAHDPDEGANAVIQYSIIGGQDADAFTLVPRQDASKAELLTRIELDYESPRKRFELIIRAASPPLRTDIPVEVFILDVNDNAPILQDFRIVFNNFANHFPVGPIGRVPVFDADVTDQLHYRILSGNNAQLLHINETSGKITLSPSLNTNVPMAATMEVAVTDGLNEVKAELQLSVLLVTEAMLFNSVTVRLNNMTQEAFLSPLYNYFVEGLAAIIPCPKENIFLFNIQDDTDVESKILNISFSAKRPDVAGDVFYSQQDLKERVYLRRALLGKLATVEVLPFDDTLCVREPCVNFEECLSVLKFGNASDFISSSMVLFRPIYPVSTFACRCPTGFTGMREHYVCDTEVNLCYSNPCQFGGTCMRKEGGYTCLCPAGFTGTNCEVAIQENTVSKSNCTSKLAQTHTSFCELRTRSFNKGSYLTFPALRQRHRLHLKLSFATRENHGLLLYNGRYNERHDFIALEVVDGNLQFSYSLGANVTRVKTDLAHLVHDGKWHSVTVSFINRTVTLSVDECDTKVSVKYGGFFGGKWRCAVQGTQELEPRCSQFTETCHRFLDLTAPLQLGGLPALSTHFPIKTQHFVGCLRDFQIDHKFVDLNSFVADNGTLVGCPEKRDFCHSAPCLNGGKCSEGWGTYVCECSALFDGKDCSEAIDAPKQFSGDGFIIFTPNLRPIQLPWYHSLSFRTRQENGLLMRVDIGTNIVSTLEIHDGKIVYRCSGQEVHLDSELVNNGKWHNIQVKWMMNEVWLSLDHGVWETTHIIDAKIQGLYAGKVAVAGMESNSETAFVGFKGCIQDIRLGNTPNAFLRSGIEHRVTEGCRINHVCVTDTCPAHGACVDTWEAQTCVCEPGYAGADCLNICEFNPCENNGTCITDRASPKGYKCQCNHNISSGEHCEITLDQPCPASWWGYPVCGPCQCDTERGYDANCNKTTGECVCETNHYRPEGSDRCLECDCYTVGSFGPRCNEITGQCQCRPGVIGRRCDSCTNRFAEVTLNGCEVIYDACPRSFEAGVWWDRTFFDQTAVRDCPTGSKGQGSRFCHGELGWQSADLFSCTSLPFAELRDTLNRLQTGQLVLSPALAIRLAQDLHKAVRLNKTLYGSDIVVGVQLLNALLRHETQQSGLNLSHTQDKDYIKNLITAASVIFQMKYHEHWERMEGLVEVSADSVILNFREYAVTLIANQGDTYTTPFEVVTDNMIFGMDTVTSENIVGYEKHDNTTLTNEGTVKLVIPDTSHFLDMEPNGEVYISFPKYNNYVKSASLWDRTSKIRIPLSLLSISSPKPGEVSVAATPEKAVVSYAMYRTAGALLPGNFESNLRQRYGVELSVLSPLLSVVFRDSRGAFVSSVNPPIRHKLRVDHLSQRANPQCVFWRNNSVSSGSSGGSWSRTGCKTEFKDRWAYEGQDFHVNCTCPGLSPVTVVTNREEPLAIAEPSVAEDVVTYVGLVASVAILATTLGLLAILRGMKTNSNAIHRNLIGTLLMVQLVFLLALKLRRSVIQHEFSCKLMAMSLHYLWVSVFSWLWLEAVHLYRMLTELRDVNHGPMRCYYGVGYGMPAVVLGLSVGVRADQYGNVYFCWLSVYESVIWSLVGPVCVLLLVSLLTFSLGLKAAFTLKEDVEGYGNLRSLLWSGLGLLALTGCTWTLAVLSASDHSEVLFYAYSVCSVLEGVYVLLAYCILNVRVREGLRKTLLIVSGKKLPFDEVVEGRRPAMSSRSALAYHNRDFGTMRRNVGISTSSTTSRSTCKTGSSPYRSDARNPSTSTGSRLDSVSDLRPHSIMKYQYNYDSPTLRKYGDDSSSSQKRKNSATESESERRSIDLASSHSSDDDDTSKSLSLNRNSRDHRKPELPSKPNFMPNICEYPEDLGHQHERNIPSLRQSPVVPNIRPLYSTAWSNQLPPAYPSTYQGSPRWAGERLSNATISDNENNVNPLDVSRERTPLGLPGHSLDRMRQLKLGMGYSSYSKSRDQSYIMRSSPQSQASLKSPEYDEDDEKDFGAPSPMVEEEEEEKDVDDDETNNLDTSKSQENLASVLVSQKMVMPSLTAMHLTDSEYV